MNHTIFVIVLVALGFIGLACVAQAPVLTPTPAPTVDIGATVAAAVAAALPTSTNSPPLPTPNVEATVEASIQATKEAILTPMPILPTVDIEAIVAAAVVAALPTSTPTPRPTPIPPTPTPAPLPTASPTAVPTLIPTIIPTATPAPAPTPAPTPIPTVADMIEAVRPSIVQIKTNLGSGSGFIFEISRTGGTALVLTNAHVVEGTDWISVILNDSATLSGKISGVDPAQDLAVLKICCGRFQALVFGDASSLRAGVRVIAIGYPLGISGTASVTDGIVSAVLYDKGRWVIQTDAAINPGNSGGPLLSLSGKVLGINTYRYETTESGRPVEGMGFAVSEASVIPFLALKSGYSLPTPNLLITPTPTPKPLSTPMPRSTATPISTPAPATWRTYRNPLHGYVIDVAPGWAVDDSNLQGVRLTQGTKAQLEFFGPFRQSKSIKQFTQETIEHRRDESTGSFELLLRSEVPMHGGYGFAVIEYREQLGTEYCVTHARDILLIVVQSESEIRYEVLGLMCENSPYMTDIMTMQSKFFTRLREGRK